MVVCAGGAWEEFLEEGLELGSLYVPSIDSLPPDCAHGLRVGIGAGPGARRCSGRSTERSGQSLFEHRAALDGLDRNSNNVQGMAEVVSLRAGTTLLDTRRRGERDAKCMPSKLADSFLLLNTRRIEVLTGGCLYVIC